MERSLAHHLVGAAALSNDRLAGHRSPSHRGGTSFVRSTSEILSLLEGGGGGAIDTDPLVRKEEDGFANGDKSQGHGVEGGTEEGGGAAALPLKTHKEEGGSSKREWDDTTFHETDEVITTTTSETSERGWPPFGISRQVVDNCCSFYLVVEMGMRIVASQSRT